MRGETEPGKGKKCGREKKTAELIPIPNHLAHGEAKERHAGPHREEDKTAVKMPTAIYLGTKKSAATSRCDNKNQPKKKKRNTGGPTRGGQKNPGGNGFVRGEHADHRRKIACNPLPTTLAAGEKRDSKR